MRIELLFPTVLIVLDILAGAVYAVKGDGWNAVYWMSAALISFSVVAR